MMLDHAAIRRILPHRHPMLLVDRVLTLESGARIEALKAVTGSEPCYAGLDAVDGPGFDYPVSLLLESLAQTGALLWLHSAPGNGFPLFGSASDIRLHGRVRPGDVLRHLVRLQHVNAGTAMFGGETWVGDSRVLTAGSMFAVIRPDIDSRPGDRPSAAGPILDSHETGDAT
ncbi:3-hydroxyacyl-ACP dehydratase FabZ family protein [Salinispora vitiensis]|uniref:3-hydroxyacyl-ACP dehydratase FabZ family protein n=1 Tax=Salinispora vitiensis TaxID=999544 RepID=UPI000364DDB0|nr:beta-hydroxyacyl-ACP dehydratase [Salinispora vitiensis]